MKFPLLGATALLLMSGGLHAQSPGAPPPPAAGNGEIRGVVIDSENRTGVAMAAVAVWSSSDSTLVAGAVVRPDGSFRIQGLHAGAYHLRVTAPAYTAGLVDGVTVSPALPRVDAGQIAIARAAVLLDALVVQGEASAVAIAPDRNVYRARDVAPAGGTASDVLQAVPAVHVDMDGKVSLRGNENVVVQINGRPTPLRGEQLAGYLRQLPSSVLDRVEVIPNPSARHDPEGMAGIINVVLKQNVDLGLSGGFTAGTSSADRHTVGANLGYQVGRVTLFTTYGFSADDQEITGINDRTRLGSERVPLAFTDQVIDGGATSAGHSLNTTLDYRLGARDVLSTGLLLSKRASTDSSFSAYSERDHGGNLVARYDRSRDYTTENWLIDYTLGFKRTLVPQRHELSAEVRINRSDFVDHTGLLRHPRTNEGEGVGLPLEAENSRVDALTHHYTAQADYIRSLGTVTKLETGYKGTVRRFDRDYDSRVDPLGTGEWVPDALSNRFHFDERAHAIYGVLSHGTGRFDLQAGLRAEHAARDFELIGLESFPHSYASVFPSGIVSYQPGQATKVKLSYSRRIRRPAARELNPFPVFFDQQNAFLGNPQLSPEYADVFELSYQRSGRLGSLQVAPFYRRTTDIIRFIINTADTVAGREVTSVSFRNLDRNDSWGTDITGSVRVGRTFTGFANFVAVKIVTDGGSAESSLSSDAVTWFGRLNGSLNLTPRTTLQAMYFYRAPMNIERGRFSGSSMADVSLRHNALGDRGSVTLRVTDPFATMGFRLDAGDDNLIQVSERRFNARAVHLAFQYNFGRAPRVRQRRPEHTEQQPGFPE